MGARLEALTAAAKQFRSYEEFHYAKKTEEGNNKALTNGLMAEQMERALSTNGDFSIGSDVWPGLSKLVEEDGELTQVLGKILGAGGAIHHWDGSNLAQRAEEEIADVLAAIDYFVEKNKVLRVHVIQNRRNDKLKLFRSWHDDTPPLPGDPTEELVDFGGARIDRLQLWEGSTMVKAIWTDGYENSLDLRNYPAEDEPMIRRRLESLRSQGQVTS